MIFYFTGTGNSLYVAKKLSDTEVPVSISERVKLKDYKIVVKTGESLGFVFPVYFWGLPSIVDSFLNSMEIVADKDLYLYVVFTCGANIGRADSLVEQILAKKGRQLSAAFSVSMPDNYILMYDIKIPRNEKKLEKSVARVMNIKATIRSRKADPTLLHHGSFSRLSTALAYPIYKKNRKTDAFYATDLCIDCGLCATICPMEMISIVDRKPQWKSGMCVHCLACIHRCPVQAIQYGNHTLKRGRYVHPDLVNPPRRPK